MDIYTAQYRYNGPDRLDITVSKRNNTWGRAFAPTRDIVMGHKNGTLSDKGYTEQYHAMMNTSIKLNVVNWHHLLTLKRVTFVCFCPPDKFCHRVILANIVQVLSPDNKYHGEIHI